jgi:hypothetical protein
VGHSRTVEGYDRLVVTGFRTDGYPQGVRRLWTYGTRCGVVRLVGEGLAAAGGARGSNGSRALQASLARCLRIASTTRAFGDEGDDFHLRSAGTQKRVHLEGREPDQLSAFIFPAGNCFNNAFISATVFA